MHSVMMMNRATYWLEIMQFRTHGSPFVSIHVTVYYYIWLVSMHIAQFVKHLSRSRLPLVLFVWAIVPMWNILFCTSYLPACFWKTAGGIVLGSVTVSSNILPYISVAFKANFLNLTYQCKIHKNNITKMLLVFFLNSKLLIWLRFFSSLQDESIFNIVHVIPEQLSRMLGKNYTFLTMLNVGNELPCWRLSSHSPFFSFILQNST